MASKDEARQEPVAVVGLEAAENIRSNGPENGDEAEDASVRSVEGEEPRNPFVLNLPEEVIANLLDSCNYILKFIDDLVWEIILNKLTNADDRRNCCTAFSLFDQLLANTKPVWMFKLILPFVYPYLGKEDKLTCRRVCTQWYAEIDRFNPGRQNWNVCIRSRSDHVAHEYLRKLFELLSKFGEYVWTLEFKCSPANDDNTRDSLVASYLCLQQVLTKTPNLRHLIFFGTCALYTGIGSMNQYRAQRLALVANPLPAIPSLESLKAVCLSVSGFPVSLTNSLISPYALHLQTIQTEWTSIDQAFLGRPLPNLKHLDLREVPYNHGLEKLLLLRLNAPLKKLEIEFKSRTLLIDDCHGFEFSCFLCAGILCLLREMTSS